MSKPIEGVSVHIFRLSGTNSQFIARLLSIPYAISSSTTSPTCLSRRISALLGSCPYSFSRLSSSLCDISLRCLYHRDPGVYVVQPPTSVCQALQLRDSNVYASLLNSESSERHTIIRSHVRPRQLVRGSNAVAGDTGSKGAQSKPRRRWPGV